MIDPADNQTQELPLVQPKRGRGRPVTGAAMTPAEKQRAYRQRQAEQRSTQVPIKTIEIITEEAGAQIASLEKQLAEAKVKILDLERELKKSNVTECLGIPDVGVWTVQFMMTDIGRKSWVTCDSPCIDFEGIPDKFEQVKSHVDYMQEKGQVRNKWRAVRDDGLIYEAKAPKLQRRQRAKPKA